ncbi:Lysophosphatidic acid:oleoyl-CoA acyltransferase 1 [Paecilomyces lecythidis]|uniref:Lysophosphatidic acid:oleoyl-CoA acyltransferase 1 n=1 Tax=Paecilomyces lecythidis TaxID=3004212 RepID=A0ABR3Y9E7_9EURO
MEKFSQFRDRGSGIAPFLPIPTEPAGLYLPFHIFLFCFRLPLLLVVSLTYFLVLQWLPIGSLGKKASLWCILGIPSIWWIDLQIDGVKRGSLAKQRKERLPGPGSIIASSFTSPIDAVYLAAIFDPIFTACYPSTRQVEQISLFQAILRALSYPKTAPPSGARMVDISTLVQKNPNRPIVMFPECTTTNGRGILPLSHALLKAPSNTKIFPLSLRYTPADVTTPVPGSYQTFFWNLLSKPTHCIRVRIAECVTTGGSVSKVEADTSSLKESHKNTYGSNYFDTLQESASREGSEASLTREQKAVLDYVGEALARLGRVKRVGLGVKDKQDFVKMWTKSKRRR